MRRFVYTASVTLLLGSLTGCKGSTASRGPDAVVAPADLARGLAENRQATFDAYDGKILELAGTVGKLVQPGGPNPTMGVVFASIDERLGFDSGLSFVSFDPEDGAATAEFDGLSVGGRVTLHCRLERLNESGSLFKVGNCRVQE